MACVIYTRVSLSKQYSSKSVSLNAQENICNQYALSANINVSRIYKEVCSTFKKIPPMLKAASLMRNVIIICADVSRFSRSVNLGLMVANRIVDNGGKIIFITENFIYDINKSAKLKSYLEKTEYESQIIGMRVRRSNSFIRSRGGLTNGVVPYGFNYTNTLTKNKHEINIINFINIARTANFSLSAINMSLKKIKKTNTPIELLDENMCAIDKINRRLTYQEIADLLNSYNIDKRKIKWNANTVNTAVKSFNRQNASKVLSLFDTIKSIPSVDSEQDGKLFKEFCKFRQSINSKK